MGDCMCSQRGFQELCAKVDLGELGLTSRPVDLVVPLQRMRSSGRGARFHVWGGVVPPNAFLRLGDVLVSGSELVILQLCSAQGKLDELLDAHASAVKAEMGTLAGLGIDEPPAIDHPLEWERTRRLLAAATLMCEFAGTYRLVVDGRGVTYHAPRLSSLSELRTCVDAAGSTSGTRRARRVCDLAFDGSASPMETALAIMLTFPPELGGFGLPRPVLNRGINVSFCQGTLSDREVVTPDFLWESQRVALEYDSDEFHADRGERQLENDSARTNILSALGYRVFRATTWTMRSPERVALLARQLASALGVELEATTPVRELRRRKLFLELMPRRVG